MTTLRTLSIVIGVFSSMLVIGCGSSRTPNRESRPFASCIKDTQQDLVIRWGTSNDSTQLATTYEMDARGWLDVVNADGADTTREELRLVPSDDYCAKADMVTKTFVKVQALHSPGTKARFIEYANPRSGVFLRSVWNPDLNTFQSRDMRALYDSLMTLVQTP